MAKKQKSGNGGKATLRWGKREKVIGLIAVLVTLGAIYFIYNQVSADTAAKSTGLTGLSKCQYNMKTGCKGFFDAVKSRDTATKNFLAKGGNKALLNKYYSEAGNVTKIALKTKDLPQCQALQKQCSTYKEDYKTLVGKDLPGGSIVSANKDWTPKKVAEAPKVKAASKEEATKIKACQKTLSTEMKNLKKDEYTVRKKSAGAHSFWSGDRVKRDWAAILRPVPDMSKIEKEANKMNDASICNKVVGETQSVRKDFASVINTLKNNSAYSDSEMSAVKKALEEWRYKFYNHKSTLEKILDNAS